MQHTADESPVTLWPEATIDELLRRIASGESVADACARPGMPGRSTFFRWLGVDARLAAKYADSVAAQVRARYVKE
ncbi:terminase small subunit-like protein [Pseudomonas aeruginosa]